MRTVAITQRVCVDPEHGERRDCLDQAWPRFVAACGLLPLVLPNLKDVALEMFSAADPAGLILTGGNDLAALGGEAAERDAAENALLDVAQSRGLPVIGVCRGMQLIQQRFSVPLCPVPGHVAQRLPIVVNGEPTEVNSYHGFGAFGSNAPLEIWAIASDGVVKAIRHPTRPITGIMWHPERNTPFAASDVALFRRVFAVPSCAP